MATGFDGRTELRVLFTFDRQRKAIVFLDGDKSSDWRGWYRVNIPIADDVFDEHHRILDTEVLNNRQDGERWIMRLKSWQEGPSCRWGSETRR